VARRWVQPFQSSFPDFEMEIVDLVADGEKVVARSGTHRGDWFDVPGTRRRFEQVDEIYIFEVRDGKLVSASESRTTEPDAAARHLPGAD
jgi:predicted ester cyclase